MGGQHTEGAARGVSTALTRREGLARLAAWGCGAAGVLAAGAGSAAGPGQSSAGFYATPLAPDSWQTGFALHDVQGKLRRSTAFPGQVLVLFFGFLSCPSICPTTLFELSAAQRALGARARQVQIAFATLDPERDSAAAMLAWLAQFGPQHLGLRDTPQAIAAAAGPLRLKYERVPGSSPGSYTIDHGVQAYVFDPKGRLRLLVRPGPSPEEVAQDFAKLLQGA